MARIVNKALAEIDGADLRVATDFLRRAFGDQAAAVEHEDTVRMLEHHVHVVLGEEHADRILVLNRGALIAEGSPEQVRGDPQVRAIYLGEGLVYDPRHREGAPA